MAEVKEYYCTKWWKSDGLEPSVMFGREPENSGYVTLSLSRSMSNASVVLKFGEYCFSSKESAKDNIVLLIKKEIVSLKKKTAKLEKLLEAKV